jgi:maleate isomerase
LFHQPRFESDWEGRSIVPDLIGYRAKMAVVVPATNTTMEPELHAMAPRGVTIHTARLRLTQAAIRSPEEARAAVAAMQSGLEIAIRDVTTAEPDHLLIGVSALSFIGG